MKGINKKQMLGGALIVVAMGLFLFILIPRNNFASNFPIPKTPVHLHTIAPNIKSTTTPANTPTAIAPTSTHAVLPVSISAASISLTANIVPVGTVHGAIGIPPNPKTVAYWTGGVIPGQSGVAILDGHLDWYGVPCAVFCYLGSLKKGNTIIIKFSNNSTETWRVGAISTVNNGNVPAFMLQHIGPPTMALITCAGDWNAAAQSYTQRLLVVAQLVDIHGKL